MVLEVVLAVLGMVLMFGTDGVWNFKQFVSALLMSYRHQAKFHRSYHLAADFDLHCGWIGMVLEAPKLMFRFLGGPRKKCFIPYIAPLLLNCSEREIEVPKKNQSGNFSWLVYKQFPENPDF